MKRIEETMGTRIRQQRIMIGMTQDELAEKLCIPKTTISAYENDKIDIKGSRIAELARALFTTPNYLLGFEEEKNEEQRMDEGILAMLGRIKDEKIKKMLMVQIEAMVKACGE
jgi:transcriptional regulator with XRE-family HTH domain